LAEQHFGPYRLEELIGRGGMGEVYRAFDTVRKRPVALKRLRPDLIADPEFQARFRAESELAARLRSAHVIPIHDYGEIDGRLFIDMRLVDGEDMSDRLAARGGMDATDVVHVIGQIAGALDAAHAAGLVHRDVKPSNVLLSPGDGVNGQEFAYLVDFGIARAADGTGSLTGSGPIVGTVDYMAPERFERGAADHRVDVYALACVMFEALTGMKPFLTESLAALLYSHLNAPPPRPSVRRPGVSAAFDAVIARGMAKNPDARYASCGALAAAARAALQASPVAAGPVPVSDGPRRHSGRHGRHGRPDTDATQDLRAPGRIAGSPPHEFGSPSVPTGPRSRRFRRGWAIAGVAGLAAAAATVGGVLLTRSDPAQLFAAGADPTVLRVADVLPISYALGIAVDPSSDRYYVGALADEPVGTTRKLEVQTYRGSAPTPTGTMSLPEETLAGLAVAADGSRLAALTWTVPDNLAATPGYVLTVIDPNTQAATATVQLSGPIESLVLSPDGTRAYLVGGSDLQVVDTVGGRLIITVPLGAAAQDVAVTPDGRSVLVTSSTGVKIFDAPGYALRTTIGLRDDPNQIAVTPEGQHAIVLVSATNALAIVDLAGGTVTGGVAVGESPGDVALTPDGAQALVTNRQAGTVTAINLADATMFTVSVGDQPKQLAFSSAGGFGLVVTSTNIVRLERVPV
jgi:serine/threonine protein kinase, bacterial